MKRIGIMGALLAAASAAAAAPAEFLAKGDFDFYVLALSWSPGFCDAGGAEKAGEQCAVGAARGFVLHGLWPENAARPYPANCAESVRIPGDALRETHDVYPSESLARYEYRKHGTCTGLDPKAYFGAAKYAFDRIAIPPALKAPRAPQTLPAREIADAFIAANPDLTSANFALTCSRGELVEVRVCLAKTLDSFVDCPKVAGHSCRSSQVKIAPLR